jgi:hypothetical protein
VFHERQASRWCAGQVGSRDSRESCRSDSAYLPRRSCSGSRWRRRGSVGTCEDLYLTDHPERPRKTIAREVEKRSPGDFRALLKTGSECRHKEELARLVCRDPRR